MGLVFKNKKQLYTDKTISRSTEPRSKVFKRKTKNIKLTRKSKQILIQLGFELRQNA
jgi:hypothetical protein